MTIRSAGARHGITLATLLAIALMAACAGTGGGEPLTSPPGTTGVQTTAQITAPTTEVLIGGQVAFSGTVSGSARWSVNGVPGGNPTSGTITAAGLFTAPSAVPLKNPVTVRLQSTERPGDSSTVSLTLLPAPRAGVWVVHSPRILDVASTDSIAIVAHAGPTITRLDLAPAGSPPRAFRHLGGQLYQINVAASAALSAYTTGDLHAFLGYIDYYAGAVREMRGNAFASVRDATVPTIAISNMATDARLTDYVLNLRISSTLPAAGVDERDVTKRLYQLLPDQFDFLAVVQPMNFYQNRYYIGVRNSVSGIGVVPFDAGATFGSASRLQGVIHYPIDGYFDLGETTASHELGHRWINFLTGTPFAAGTPHWPVSSLASGVMGLNIPGGNVGGAWPNEIVPQPDGSYRIVPAKDTGVFKDLDLYLMGLMAPGEVKPHVIFNNQTQFAQGTPAVPTGTVTTVSVDDVVAARGARLPAYPAAQSVFRVGTIVLSFNTLLTDSELAYFSHLAARGESKTTLRYTSGFSAGTTKPFYLATWGRGELVARMR